MLLLFCLGSTNSPIDAKALWSSHGDSLDKKTLHEIQTYNMEVEGHLLLEERNLKALRVLAKPNSMFDRMFAQHVAKHVGIGDLSETEIANLSTKEILETLKTLVTDDNATISSFLQGQAEDMEKIIEGGNLDIFAQDLGAIQRFFEEEENDKSKEQRRKKEVAQQEEQDVDDDDVGDSGKKRRRVSKKTFPRSLEKQNQAKFRGRMLALKAAISLLSYRSTVEPMLRSLNLIGALTTDESNSLTVSLGELRTDFSISNSIQLLEHVKIALFGLSPDGCKTLSMLQDAGMVIVFLKQSRDDQSFEQAVTRALSRASDELVRDVLLRLKVVRDLLKPLLEFEEEEEVVKQRWGKKRYAHFQQMCDTVNRLSASDDMDGGGGSHNPKVGEKAGALKSALKDVITNW